MKFKTVLDFILLTEFFGDLFFVSFDGLIFIPTLKVLI